MRCHRAEMARKAEEVGVTKAASTRPTTFALAVLAGAFIAHGSDVRDDGHSPAARTSRTASRGCSAGSTFSLGLILVVVAGAELFTGNNLIVMAWASRRVSTARLLRNWAIVYAGNFAGAIATAALLYAGKQYEFGKGAVGEQALSIAADEDGLGFVPGHRARHALQRARLPRGLALLQRAYDSRQDPRDRPADHRLRRGRLRAQRREHVLHPVSGCS